MGSLLTLLANNNFSPRMISDLKLWLDAADLSTITESGGLVSQWNDKSGNGYNATQGTSSSQPATGISTKNNKNVLDFDDDSMSLPSGLYSVANGNSTIFVVARRNSEEAVTDGIIGFRVGGTSRLGINFSGTAGRVSYFSNTTSSAVHNSGNINTVHQLIYGRRSGTTQAISVNRNTEVIDIIANNISAVDLILLGYGSAGVSLNGEIAEIIIYGKSLSENEIQFVEQYLKNKWGL